MFAWLKRKLLGKSNTCQEIFEYLDANGMKRRADPLEIWRRIEDEVGPYWLDALTPLGQTVFKSMPPEAVVRLHQDRQTTIKLVSGWVRSAFRISSFAEGGPTDVWCMNLLADYLRFVNTIEAEYRPFYLSRKRDAPSPSTPSEPSTA